MKTVAFVPIKLNNERFPGKNLKCFDDGTPLVCVLFNKLLQMKKTCMDEAYVFCSDEAIIPYIPDGIRFLKRSTAFDKKETKGTGIYEAFVKAVDADVYVLAHATSPFVRVAHMEECIRAVQSGGYDSAFCGRTIQSFLWENNKPLNFQLNDPPRTQDMTPIYQEISTPYVFSKDAFLRYGARTGVNPFICPCDEIEAIDVDYPEDFSLANTIYMHSRQSIE